VTVKASFSNDQKLVLDFTREGQNDFQQVSHTTQLQGFRTYTTVNLSDKVGTIKLENDSSR